MKNKSKNALTFFGGLVLTSAYRLLRIFPNNDPIMGFALPIARNQKWWQAFLFPALAMACFDVLTAKVGPWTVITAVLYGTIGVMFHFYFRKKTKVGLGTYAKLSVVGVLAFDFFTGPIMTSYLFKIPFSVALIGQIPFTLLHLASAVTITVLLAPVLDPSVRSLPAELKHRIKSRFFSGQSSGVIR
ncbi:MAG: hypothetical protein V1777_05440 [Candidatus Micrarchaeota archaeon]